MYDVKLKGAIIEQFENKRPYAAGFKFSSAIESFWPVFLLLNVILF